MIDHWPNYKQDFPEPWNKERRAAMIEVVDAHNEVNTRQYQALREHIEWESPQFDIFAGKAFRLGNLRNSLLGYSSEKLEEMKRGFEEL